MRVCEDCDKRTIFPNCHDNCSDYMKAKILHACAAKAERFEKMNDVRVSPTLSYFRRPGGIL